MWARGPPPDSDGGGSALTRMITRKIAGADSITALADVFVEWGGRFDHIHAAAALVMYAKLSRGRPDRALSVKLINVWLRLMPDASLRECANVLYAAVSFSSGKAAVQLWDTTWAAYMQRLQQNMQAKGKLVPDRIAVIPQNLSNALWACAKLRKQPTADELQLLVQAFLQPDVLAAAKPQETANFVWAVGELYRAPGWQGALTRDDVQRILGQQQIASVVTTGNSQNVSNILVALAHMVVGQKPLVSTESARAMGQQLLAQVDPMGIKKHWKPQHITNVLWACSGLGLVDTSFTSVVIETAPSWLPNVYTGYDLTQAATACAQMQYRDEVFLRQLLQHGLQLLQQQQQQPGKVARTSLRRKQLSAADKASLATLCSTSIAKLDMQQLAGLVRDLVASSGIRQQPNSHPSNLRRIWVVHSWLLEKQLLDGKGLAGLVTEQQLQQGQKEADEYGFGL